MYFAISATHKPSAAQQRTELADAFHAYLHDHPDHPDVAFIHGGPTLADDAETVVGSQAAIRAPSLEAARAFVADSPYGKAGIFEDLTVRPWKWITGRPD